MANAAALTSFQSGYGGFGVPSIGPIDSGDVTVTATPSVTTLTVPANADGTQPVVRRGQVLIELSALNVAAVLGMIEVLVGDGTSTEYSFVMPASTTLTAGQGLCIVVPIFSTLINITTIRTITVRTITTVNNNYTKHVQFIGERD